MNLGNPLPFIVFTAILYSVADTLRCLCHEQYAKRRIYEYCRNSFGAGFGCKKEGVVIRRFFF